MNKLLRITGVMIGCALVLMAGKPAAAQTEKGPPAERGPAAMKGRKGVASDPEQRLRLMTRNMGLTQAQQDKIRPILEKENRELETLRGNNEISRDERRAKLQQLNKTTSDQVRAILTPEQQKIHDEIRARITENRAKKRSPRSPLPGPQPYEFDAESRLVRLTDHLGLSTEQQAKIKPILEAENAALEKLPGNDGYNREQRREKLLQLNQESYEKILPILTPEQQEKYKNTRKKIMDRRTQKKRGDSAPGAGAK